MNSKHSNAALSALGDVIQKELSAAQILERFVDAITSQLQADRGTVFLLDESGKELVSITAHLPELKEIRVPLSQGVAGYVARTGHTSNIPNGKRSSPIWRAIDQQTGYTTRSMLTGPLYNSERQLIGVLQILNKQRGTFDQRDEHLFTELAAQMASLLEETTLSRRPNLIPSTSGQGEQRASTPALPMGDQFNRIIGSSRAMRSIFKQIRKVAPTDAGVLLRGESGTGKGLIARAIHHNSKRSQAPLVHVDCTTLPEGLMENELFGHERGAYTGAHSQERGKVEAAQGGTLFLDEVGDLPLQLQGKLLTLIQDKTFRRVGGTQLQRADIRIVTATNRPLEHLVQTGQFRADLYYRLRIVEIVLPPLRQRGKEDTLRLINHFVTESARRHHKPIHSIRQDALRILLAYSWPGNVRELENCLESAVIFADGEITPSSLSLVRPASMVHSMPTPFASHPATHIHAPSLSPALTTYTSPHTPEHLEENESIPLSAWDTSTEAPAHPFSKHPSMQELESMYIRYLLKQHKGNRSACARILGIGRNTLLRKIKAYQLMDIS